MIFFRLWCISSWRHDARFGWPSFFSSLCFPFQNIVPTWILRPWSEPLTMIDRPPTTRATWHTRENMSYCVAGYDGDPTTFRRQKLSPMFQVGRAWSFLQTPILNWSNYHQGWTIFDKLYLLNGTLYIVSDEPSKIPIRQFMISTGVPVENGDVEYAKRVPTDKEMQVITPQRAKQSFGLDAELIDGVSVSFPPSISRRCNWSENMWGFLPVACKWRSSIVCPLLLCSSHDHSFLPPA